MKSMHVNIFTIITSLDTCCFCAFSAHFYLYTLYVCCYDISLYFFSSFLLLLLLSYFTEMTSNISLVTLYSLGTKSLHNAGLECFFLLASLLLSLLLWLLLLLYYSVCRCGFASFRIPAITTSHAI